MRTRRMTQLAIAKFYQRLENNEKRRKEAEKKKRSFFKKLLNRA